VYCRLYGIATADTSTACPLVGQPAFKNLGFSKETEVLSVNLKCFLSTQLKQEFLTAFLKTKNITVNIFEA